MNTRGRPWDYLILTASNESQAQFYRSQLKLRHKLGLLSGVKQTLVVADPQGQRIGSGGSTIFSLLKVINRECKNLKLSELNPQQIEKTLSRLWILIIHAGGDSRRMPAYGPCGKIFTPIPGASDSVLGNTIFDRQFPIYRELPITQTGQGQVVITTGDVLLFFSPQEVKFQGKGITGLGCSVSPEQAKKHGVFVTENNREIRFFLQKPSVSEQKKQGAIDSRGQALLDIGVMKMDASTSAKLITLVDIKKKNSVFGWTDPRAQEISSADINFYRDICCAMGKKVSFDAFTRNVRSSGSKLSESFLRTIFDTLSRVPFFVHPLKECTFLHFGTPRQLIETGLKLKKMEQNPEFTNDLLSLNNHISDNKKIRGKKSWIEGCRIRSDLTLEGENVLVGADVNKPLSLKAKTCLDVIKGSDRNGQKVWFVRMYSLDDSFKTSIYKDLMFINVPLTEWLRKIGASQEDIWNKKLPDHEKNLWNARIFPAVYSPSHYHEWLWMENPLKATDDQIQAWKSADKYSLEEMAHLADLDNFHQRRWDHRIKEIHSSLSKIFQPQSPFSSQDLQLILKSLDDKNRENWIHDIFAEACRHLDRNKNRSGIDSLIFSRAVHTLGTAVRNNLAQSQNKWDKISHSVLENMSLREKKCLFSMELDSSTSQEAEIWCSKLKESAFENLSQTIVWSQRKPRSYPQCAVRSDAIIWGRAPARLDLGGGWTDTPPYALENGGCVINTAVNLNRQPPIHVYARVIDEPAVRITSIDHGMRVTIRDWEDLMDYRKATSKFSLAKAALVLSGFSLETAARPKGTQSLKDMLEHFGGGIELTTLAAIPSGSGLGTSSIMGAVLISVINRMIGQETSQRELFNKVLQLEQELTTGGGWQDQIGGILRGTKIITTKPGLVPNPDIQAVKSNVLDPKTNQSQTLLYYTGMRRLAKNILQHIVGCYLDRDRKTMETLRKLHAFPPLLVEAMERENMQHFGELIGRALQLKKEIDPDSTNPEIEGILKKFKPYMIGATILGAGGGGFLLVVAQSPHHAEAARKALTKDPPNPLARFFDFNISVTGLEISVC
jgi:fucokinase